MKKLIGIITVFCLFVVLPVFNVEAKPGVSLGKSFSSSPRSTSVSPAKTSPTINKSQRTNTQRPLSNPATSMNKRSWLSWLPFIGLGMMLGHFGIGSIFSIISTLILIAAVWMLIKRIRGGHSRRF